MLRDERQIAIDEVVVACRESIDHYNDAAEHVDDDVLGLLFTKIAADRRRLARQLESCQRAAGELPRAPDADRETFQQLYTNAKAALFDDGRDVFLQARLESEMELDSRLHEARAMNQPDDIRACLDAIQKDVDDARAKLAEASETPHD